MTEGERDETTADPFCGFNLGSTVFRATPDKEKPAQKFIFESPVVRLMSDEDYRDVYRDGFDLMDPGWSGPLSLRSIIIYRYYEQASSLLGTGKVPEIEDFAKGLSGLILQVRDLACKNPDNGIGLQDFRCYLVAHSMGGLVCRAFLQNPDLGSDAARRCVDKVFTYATPHNGVEVVGLNIPKWLSVNDMNNFNRDRMAGYLNLKARHEATKRVDWLPAESFPAERFFCMVGTNRGDYEVAMGLSRAFAGHGSDGLVRIDNASVWGVGGTPCATAYAHRSHSGYFGIVNSEESYQNLKRFLFGDLRVDIWLDVEKVLLPTDLQGKAVNALYQFEACVSPRGKRWYLTRRTAEEDSAACRSHQELTDPQRPQKRRLFLSSIFLDARARVNQGHPSLAYILALGIRVPDYEVERTFLPDTHYEGRYLFHDSLVVELTPPQNEDGDWDIVHDWQQDNRGPAETRLRHQVLEGGGLELRVPFDSTNTAPGIAGQIRFVVSEWNKGREVAPK
jgi:hypothetical protein